MSRGDVKCVLPVIGELRTLCGHPLLHKKNRREVSPSAQSEEEGDIDQLEEEHTYNEKSVLDKCASLGVDEVVSQSPKVNVEDLYPLSLMNVLFAWHLTSIIAISPYAGPVLEGYNREMGRPRA